MLGQYEIVKLLGRGGMGEVYLARDTRLSREVALKLLPKNLSADPERLARFKREAKVLASLNHENIAGLFGLEDGDGRIFLVMELARGQELAQRIAKGALPLDEAVEIARQIAAGLEEAHEKGIVHRDLKPANVMISDDGKVKVLDFGLARAFAGEATGEEDLVNSPTITAAMTQAGTILGTAAYMSPEQARGKSVDRRADIWAFGVILFEMLTGQQLFAGDTITDTLAGILKTEPDWEALPRDLPPHVERVLRRCLSKDPRQRLRDIGEARIRLEGRHVETGAPPPREGVTTTRKSSRLPWFVATVALVVAAGALWLPGPLKKGAGSTEEAGVVHFSIPIAHPLDGGAGVPQSPGQWLDSRFFDVSPDGKTLAFLVREDSSYAVGVRRLDREGIQRIPMPDYLGHIFFSPRGERIGYFASSSIQAITVNGGALTELWSGATLPRGAVWNTESTLVLPLSTDSPLWRLNLTSANLDTLSRLDLKGGERTHRWPAPLPDGRGFLVTSGSDVILNFDDAQVAAIDFADHSTHELIQGNMPSYTKSGLLIFHRSGTLYAVRFDPKTFSMSGDLTPVLDGVMYRPVSGVAQYAVSKNGTLCYVPGGAMTARSKLYWVSPDGQRTELLDQDGVIQSAAVSKDGRYLALEIDAANANIWIYNIARKSLSRLTFKGSCNRPTWDAKGEMVYFASARHGIRSIYRRRADGGGEAELVFKGNDDMGSRRCDVSSLDNQLCVEVVMRGGSSDLYRVDPEHPDATQPFLDSRFMEADPSFSPDGRWLAYSSDETGTPEVYCRRFPEGDQKQKVSSGGGRMPHWSQDGSTLYYMSVRAIMQVSVKQTETLEIGVPTTALNLRESQMESALKDLFFARRFEVGPQKNRFLLTEVRSVGDLPDRMEIVLDWFEELKQKLDH